jgi:hypothetical protein
MRVAFALRMKNKITGEALLAFTCYWLVSMSFSYRLPLKEYKIVYVKKKEFEDIDVLLIYFSLFCNLWKHLFYLYHVLSITYHTSNVARAKHVSTYA